MTFELFTHETPAPVADPPPAVAVFYHPRDVDGDSLVLSAAAVDLLEQAAARRHGTYRVPVTSAELLYDTDTDQAAIRPVRAAAGSTVFPLTGTRFNNRAGAAWPVKIPASGFLRRHKLLGTSLPTAAPAALDPSGTMLVFAAPRDDR